MDHKLLFILAVCANLLLTSFYVVRDATDGNFWEFYGGQDLFIDWEVGHNLIAGKGYVVDSPAYGCELPPCDGRFRNPLYPVLLSIGPKWIQYIYGGVFSLLTVVIFSIVGGFFPILALVTLPAPIMALLSGGHETLYFLLFILSMLSLKKHPKRTAILNSLLILARFPVGTAFLTSAFLLSKEYRKWAMLPLCVAALSFMFFTGGPNQHSMFTHDYETGMAARAGIMTTSGTSQKITNYFHTLIEYLLFGIPSIYKFLYPLFIYSQFRKPNWLLLGVFFFATLQYSLFFFADRFMYFMLYGILDMTRKR